MNIFEKWLELQIQKMLLWKDKIYRKLSFDIDKIEKKREEIQDYSNDVVIESRRRNKKKPSSPSIGLYLTTDINKDLEKLADIRKVYTDIHAHRTFVPSDNVTLEIEFKYDCLILSTVKHENSNKVSATLVVYFDDIDKYVEQAVDTLHYNPIEDYRRSDNRIQFYIRDTIHTSQSSLKPVVETFRVLPKGSHRLDSKFDINLHGKLISAIKEVEKNKLKAASSLVDMGLHKHSTPILRKQWNDFNDSESVYKATIKETCYLYREGSHDIKNILRPGRVITVKGSSTSMRGRVYSVSEDGDVPKDRIEYGREVFDNDPIKEKDSDIISNFIPIPLNEFDLIYESGRKSDFGDVLGTDLVITDVVMEIDGIVKVIDGLNLSISGKDIFSAFSCIIRDSNTIGREYEDYLIGNVNRKTGKVNMTSVGGLIKEVKIKGTIGLDTMRDNSTSVQLVATKDTNIYSSPTDSSEVIFTIRRGDDVLGHIESDGEFTDSKYYIYLPSFEGWIKTSDVIKPPGLRAYYM